MRCSKAQKLINQSMDENLHPDRETALNSHLATCGECRDFAEDLRKIVSMAQTQVQDSPGEHLWQAIATESFSKTRSSKHVDGRSGHPVPLLWAGFATAGAVAIALTVALLVPGMQKPYQPVHSSEMVDQTGMALVSALDRLFDGAAETLKGNDARASETSPEFQTLLRENLAIINRSIDDYRREVEQNPTDRSTRDMLLYCYQARITLLETMQTNDFNA